MLSPFSTFEPIFFFLDIAKFFDFQHLCNHLLTFAPKCLTFSTTTLFLTFATNFFYVFDNDSIFDVSKLSPQTQIKTYYASTKICTYTRLGFQFQFRKQIFVFINMYIFPAGIDVFLREVVMVRVLQYCLFSSAVLQGKLIEC
jgi:hypothetical protein